MKDKYYFKKEKKKEFLDGHSITFLSEKLQITRAYTSLILNGYKPCSKIMVISLMDWHHLYSPDESNKEDFFKKA